MSTKEEFVITDATKTPKTSPDISFILTDKFNVTWSEDIKNHTRESYQPWPESEVCSKFRNHFAKKGTFNDPTILASFPGSGNTW